MRSIAYTSEDIKWCEATIDFLEGQLSDEARAVRSIPGPLRNVPATAAPTPLRQVPRLRQSRRCKSCRRSAAKRPQGRQPVMTLKMTKMGLW